MISVTLKKLLRFAPLCAVILMIAMVAYIVLKAESSFTNNGELRPPATEEETFTPLVVSEKSGISVTSEAIRTQAPPPPGYVEYRNDAYGFSFYHAPEGVVSEFDEGGGAMTVVLENEKRARGMQVFIVPYTKEVISEERFLLDVPSGIRTDVENTELDGMRAVTFKSYDDVLGPTHEVWVIRNGYLYEITTFEGVGRWFTPIIQSWRFFDDV